MCNKTNSDKEKRLVLVLLAEVRSHMRLLYTTSLVALADSVAEAY